ncbi:MAG: hypothetical protein EA426_03525, partial [Spirochaetaceae bacterium]
MVQNESPAKFVFTAVVAALAVIAANVTQLRLIGSTADAIWSGSRLGPTIAVLAFIAVVRAVLLFTVRVVGRRAASVPRLSLRRRIIEHLCRLGPAYLDKGTVGEVSYLATDGIEALEPFYALYLPQLFVGLIAPIGI